LKRFLYLVALLVVSVAYLIVKSPDAIVWIRPYWFDLYQLGDLYRYSYLAEYKDTAVHSPPLPVMKEKQKLSLYVIGDSFSGPFEKGHFPTAALYSFANWNHVNQSDIQLHLDTNQFNALVLQCSEKHILMRWEKKSYKPYLFSYDHDRKDTVGFEYSKKPETFLQKTERLVGRPAVAEQNIGILLFSNPVVLAIKESKASWNKFAFNRIADEVEEYPEKKILVQRLTSDLKYKYMSSFRSHSDTEISEIARNLGRINEYYRQAGFDTVLIALVPNPISVIDPEYKGRTYNQVLPRIEKSVVGLGVVSVFDEFTKGKERLFRRGDSHWNLAGEKIWLSTLNQKLDSISLQMPENKKARQ
jgi:hypothetical protein